MYVPLSATARSIYTNRHRLWDPRDPPTAPPLYDRSVDNVDNVCACKSDVLELIPPSSDSTRHLENC